MTASIPVIPTTTTEERSDRLYKLRDLIEKIAVCMVTTTGADGAIHSRPMAYLHMEADGELVFFTRAASTKAIEVRRNRQVNVIFCDAGHNLYVSVSGRALILNDRERMAEYFTPIMKQWFPVGADDPTLRLFVVDPQSAEYWDGPSGLGLFLAMTRSLLTGEKANLGDHDFFEL
jgi:general stress protein 26